MLIYLLFLPNEVCLFLKNKYQWKMPVSEYAKKGIKTIKN